MFACREDKAEEPEQPKYRDRAKERREDQNPDYEPTELGHFHAVAPPGTTDLRYSISLMFGFSLRSIFVYDLLFWFMVTMVIGLLMSTSYLLRRANILEVWYCYLLPLIEKAVLSAWVLCDPFIQKIWLCIGQWRKEERGNKKGVFCGL